MLYQLYPWIGLRDWLLVTNWFFWSVITSYYINMHGGSVPFSLHTSHQCTSMHIHPLLVIHPEMSCTNRRFEVRKTIFQALRAGFEAFVIRRIIHKHRDCRHCSSTNILIIRKSFPGSESQQCYIVLFIPVHPPMFFCGGLRNLTCLTLPACIQWVKI